MGVNLEQAKVKVQLIHTIQTLLTIANLSMPNNELNIYNESINRAAELIKLLQEGDNA